MNSASPELQRLEVLHAFKRRMPQSTAFRNVSPFDDRVSTAHDEGTAADLPEIHADVRRRIRDTIEAVRAGEKKSQVILLAGEPGTGKTHLLRTFQPPELADELGYIYVGGSNQWNIKDFQARLLDWMFDALTAPTPSSDDHLLLKRVQAIGFRAVEHLLANRIAWRQCRARPGGRGLGWLLGRLQVPSYDRCKELFAARDPAVFAALDFARFSQYVCDRFLADRSNLMHRYALRVLLAYLFPDRAETGVGTREKVLHWFRQRGDNDYFARRLGANERLDRSFALSEAVQLLVHLFSPAVSKELSTTEHPAPPRAFLLVFDQAEGRNELFETDEDWRDFFAHLSEVYNSLPNVVVLFTMTVVLRKRLQPTMERQFRDRIRMDEHFVLHLPNEEQVLSLYRSRVEYWLRADSAALERYRALDNAYVPFDRERVLAVAGQQSIRETLEAFDRAFHEEMGKVVVEPDLDFHFHLNELHQQRAQETRPNDFEYTAGHLETVLRLLQRAGPWVAAEYGLSLDKVEAETDPPPPCLTLTFTDPANPGTRVSAYIVRLTYRAVQHQVDQAVSMLSNKKRARYRLWLVRAGEIKAYVDPRREDQVFLRVASGDLESRLCGLLHLLGKQAEYEERGQWPEAQKVMLRELTNAYLAELFREARKQLDAFAAGTSPDVPEESVPANP
jgi:hypothetical protein